MSFCSFFGGEVFKDHFKPGNLTFSQSKPKTFFCLLLMGDLATVFLVTYLTYIKVRTE